MTHEFHLHLDMVDSTNNYAATQLLTKSLPEGTIISAHCQSAGKGQSGAFWESAPGMNLTFSVVLYPHFLPPQDQFLLSMTLSLAVADYLSTHTKDVAIKWPNDLYCGHEKIAGILIETAITGGRLIHAIAGIGLNVNQTAFVSDAPNPISLRRLTGRTYDLEVELDALRAKILDWYDLLKAGDFNSIRSAYAKRLYRKGMWAGYRADGADFEALLLGTDEYGQLMLETSTGEIRHFQVKEVVFRKD
ncbi:MAG: biotin--[acetyl-CoA-carboxylase] ligase [Marinilabiliales bacterium]|nr:biotin--[acetyl-CoA-carboxylase] ligase [Marinilabiliales bacterium]